MRLHNAGDCVSLGLQLGNPGVAETARLWFWYVSPITLSYQDSALCRLISVRARPLWAWLCIVSRGCQYCEKLSRFAGCALETTEFVDHR